MPVSSGQGGNPRKSFWKKVASLATGAVVSQAVNVAILPILSRLYLPTEFGVFGVFLAVVAIFAVAANLGYDMAVMLPDQDAEANGLMGISLRACIVLSCALCLILLPIPPAWIARAGQAAMVGWHLLIPVAVFLEGIIQAMTIALNRQKRYQEMTRMRIARALTNALVAVGAGMSGAGVEGLMGGFLLGQAVAAARGWWIWTRSSQWGKYTGSFITLAHKYRDFPIYGMASAWLNVASKYVIFLLMPGVFGNEATGQYLKSERVLNLAPGLISMSIGRVFFEEASEASRRSQRDLARITGRTAARLVALGLPVLIILIGWGPQVFAWVLGAQWEQAGEFARWLAPWLYLTMIAAPLSYLIDIQRKLPQFLLYNLLLFLVRTSVLVWAANRLEVGETVACFGIAGAVMMLVQILYLLSVAGVFKKDRI